MLWKDARVDDAAVPYLRALQKLRYLDVDGTAISPAARKELKLGD